MENLIPLPMFRDTTVTQVTATTQEEHSGSSVDVPEVCNAVILARMITVRGYEELKRAIGKIHCGKVHIYVLFSGDVDEKGVSWCSHCSLAEPFIINNLCRLNADDYFIKCYVGDRDYWLNPKNEFRKDPMFQVSMIPTLMKFGSHRRLSGSQCLQDHLIELVFEDVEGCESGPCHVLRKPRPRKNCCCCRVSCLS